MPEIPSSAALHVIGAHFALAPAMEAMAPEIEEAADWMTQTLASGGTIYLCGNGGSAADAQHIAAELVGRFLIERKGLPAVALHANSSSVTAIGNDYGFESVYERQVDAYCRPGDLLIGISTSGRSASILRAMARARALGSKVIGLTGKTGGEMPASSDLCLQVPTDETPRIQEMHILIGHILCQICERALCSDKP